MDIFDKIQGLDLIDTFKAQGTYPYFKVIESNKRNFVCYEGKELIMLSSNNYLGLTHDPRVIEAAIDATRQWGTGCSGSRFLTGNFTIHEELETEIAKFLNQEAALVFASGFLTNMGTIAAICKPGDYILSDRENHACIVEGCRLSGAQLIVYRNCDLVHLEKQLGRLPPDSAKLIITDGVFSMSGRIAPYDGIYALAKKYNARTYVDDAHGLGVIGNNGRGTVSHYQLSADIVSGTFSKSLASQGGFIAGNKNIIEYVRHMARTLIFSVGLSPASAAAALTALKILSGEPEHLIQLKNNTNYLKRRFEEIGLNTMGSQSSVIPILVADDQKVIEICHKLLELGVFTTPIVYPATPKGQALIRCAVMSTHTKKDLDSAIEAFKKVASLIHASNKNPNKTALADKLKQQKMELQG